MRNLKEVETYNKDNWKKIPKGEWKFIGWFKNSFQYQSGNCLIEIRDYDYRDYFQPTMSSFVIADWDDTVITLFKIGQGDELYKSRKELEKMRECNEK